MHRADGQFFGTELRRETNQAGTSETVTIPFDDGNNAVVARPHTVHMGSPAGLHQKGKGHEFRLGGTVIPDLFDQICQVEWEAWQESSISPIQ